jgi:hypothetical protein
MPSDKAALRARVRNSLDQVMSDLNAALSGAGVEKLEPVIQRLGRDGLPHWYEKLKADATLPNLDGKTVGSVLEMLLVAVLEQGALRGTGTELRVNPARGIDLPDLDLGVKSPSENFCTSEPFFSAYERLYGNEYDCLVMLTDYQTAKARPPLKLRVIQWRYMTGSEIADENLCACALTHRDWLRATGGDATVQRFFRFLAYVNQSDWRAKQLLRLANELRANDDKIDLLVDGAKADYERQNKKREREDREPIPEADLQAILAIKPTQPRWMGVLHQLDNWVTETLKDAARIPNENEWNRLLESPLNGKIGMSFALQWRYNFGRVFGEKTPPAAQEVGIPSEDLYESPVDTPDGE